MGDAKKDKGQGRAPAHLPRLGAAFAAAGGAGAGGTKVYVGGACGGHEEELVLTRSGLLTPLEPHNPSTPLGQVLHDLRKRKLELGNLDLRRKEIGVDAQRSLAVQSCRRPERQLALPIEKWGEGIRTVTKAPGSRRTGSSCSSAAAAWTPLLSATTQRPRPGSHSPTTP